MIKKLRKKFILTALISVFCLLVVILGAINFINFALVSQQADKVTEMIMNQTGGFGGDKEPPEAMSDASSEELSLAPGGQGGHVPSGGTMGPDSPETSESTRYFVAKISSEGTIQITEYKISAITMEGAIDLAESLQDKKIGWVNGTYRFRVWQRDGETYVTVIDYSRELGPSFRVLWASLIGAVVGMAITYLALIQISKLVIKPIEENDRNQKRFISNASFELKNPITIIDANKKMIEMKCGESEETKRISKEVNHLIGFTQKLDTLVSLDEKRLPQNFKEYNLSNQIKEIAATYDNMFINAHKEFIKNVDDSILITADKVQIGELINACIENGLNYADSYLKIRLQKEQERVILEFINDAKQVIDGDLDSVFERFYRSNDVKASGIEGSGIGLSIARQIVDIHKGRISAKGQGGEFILRIEL